MVWFDLQAAGCEVARFVEVGARCGVKFMGGRLVVHYREFLVFFSKKIWGGGGGAERRGEMQRKIC